jgi:HEPN/Toprim N-terminal domain 1
MGSLCQLKFDAISLLEQKSCVPDEFVCLFQESDRRELQKTEGEERDVGYYAPREVVLQRLDLLGYTTEHARCHFEKWLEQEWASGTAEALRSLNYEEWLPRAKDVLLTRYDFARPRNEYKDEIDRQMRSFQGGWLFYDANVFGDRLRRRNLPTSQNSDPRVSLLDLARLGRLSHQSGRRAHAGLLAGSRLSSKLCRKARPALTVC